MTRMMQPMRMRCQLSTPVFRPRCCMTGSTLLVIKVCGDSDYQAVLTQTSRLITTPQ